MYCLSCGKKISKISKYCKYCGSIQRIKKEVNKKENEVVWVCDFCKTEFSSKKLSDEHEVLCVDNPKNRKFPFNTNPKKGWIMFWLTTVAVFVITCFLASKFVEKGVTLLNRDILMIVFLANICLGIVAFLGIAFSTNKPRNNKLNGFVKYSLIFSLVYLIINPSVLALEGYRAVRNEQYKNKYYSGQKPTPTTIPQDSTEKILKDLNDYRTEKKMSILTLDQEMCQVAERLSKMEKLEGALKKTDYIDLCPKCNGVGYAYVENVPLVNVFERFKEGDETKKVIDHKNYKYACFVINNQRVQLFIGDKTASTSKTNTIVSSSGNIECIGPDGKQFWTSMDECKKLNEKWGKSLDYMTNCEIHPDCGGGTVRMSYSQCMKPCSGLSIKNDNQNSTNSTQTNTSTNSSPKVLFEATETSIKGKYYCYENNVNSMVTQQSLVKSYRELYETCKNSTYNQNKYSTCCSTNNCSSMTGTEGDTCYTNCYNDAYGTCNDYYSTYSKERSKLDNMRWDYCP